jgi:shikimate kinase
LTERLNWAFLDLDVRIEERAGRTVAEIFAERGEAGFREEERLAALDLSSAWECVLATGGGAWAQPEVRARLTRGPAVSVWLDAPLDTLLARLPRDGSRPLASSRERMRALLAAREPAYRLADLRVDASPAAAAVVDAIVAALFPARVAGRAASDEGR